MPPVGLSAPALALATAVLAAAPLSAWAAPEDDFERGRNAYLFGDYRAVIAALDPLVESGQRLADPNLHLQALELLGLAHYFINQRPQAKLVFQKLVRFRPDHVLNPVLVPPDAVAFYADEVRDPLLAIIEEERAAVREQQRIEEENRRLANQVLVELETVRNSRFAALLPFGIGQFQNDDPVWGGIFLGTQVVAVGLSVGFFSMAESLRGEGGNYAPADLNRARDLQTGQLISGGVAVGLMAVGIAHALFTFEPKPVILRREGPVDGRRGTGPAGGASPGTPVTPSGAPSAPAPPTGLLHWTF